MSENGRPEKQAGIRNGKGQFRPGVSGNPAGRPPTDLSVTAWVKRLAETTDTSGMSYAERVGRAVYEAAIAGDMRAAKLILDRLEPVPSGITINNGIGIGQSGLALIESIRNDPQRFRDMLRANGIDRSGDSLLDSEGE
jgi:hypothetical protein